MSNETLIIESNPVFKKHLHKIFKDDLVLHFMDDISDVSKHDIKIEPGVILLDVDYKRYDLISAIITIKKEFNCKIPIIVLADFNNFEIEKDIREVGVFSFLTKPVDFCDLEQIIFAALQYSRRRKLKLSNGARETNG